jgi:hypothetical protein
MRCNDGFGVPVPNNLIFMIHPFPLLASAQARIDTTA